MNPSPQTPEEWRPVVGYEGTYEVSNLGNVRSIDRVIDLVDGRRYRKKSVQLNRRLDPGGYATVGLSKNRKYRHVMVHKLVLASFVGPRPKGMVSRHLNGDASDPRLSNLAYGTQSQNMYDKVRHGRDVNANKTHCPRDHEYTPENTKRDKRGRRFCRKCSLRQTHIRRGKISELNPAESQPGEPLPGRDVHYARLVDEEKATKDE